MTELEAAGCSDSVIWAAGQKEALARRCLIRWQKDPAGAPSGVGIGVRAASALADMIYAELDDLHGAQAKVLAPCRHAGHQQQQQRERARL